MMTNAAIMMTTAVVVVMVMVAVMMLLERHIQPLILLKENLLQLLFRQKFNVKYYHRPQGVAAATAQ